jgi:hypothetical protein
LITTNDWPTRDALLEDYVNRTLRSMAAVDNFDDCSQC